MNKDLDGANGPRSMTESLVGLAGGLTSTAMGVTMFLNGMNSFVDMCKKGELSVTGVLGVLTSLGMAIPMVINGVKGLGTSLGITGAMLALNTEAAKSYNAE